MGLHARDINLAQFFGLEPGQSVSGLVKPKVLPNGKFDASISTDAQGNEEIVLDVSTPVYESRLTIRERQTEAEGYQWTFEFVGKPGGDFTAVYADANKIVLEAPGDPERGLTFTRAANGDVQIEATGMPAPDLTLVKHKKP